MADEGNRPNTHYGSLESRIMESTTPIIEPQQGDFYYDTALNKLNIYDGTRWVGAAFTTTTSTSSSTTTTSTSTTSTSSSTTTSTSISTSTTTSTTTTL